MTLCEILCGTMELNAYDRHRFCFFQDVMKLESYSARDQFTQRDVTFILETLARTRKEAESLMALLVVSEEADRIYDHPALAARLAATHRLAGVSMRFYLYILLRRSLLQRGLDSREIADYLANMLARFMERDQWRRAPTAQGEAVDYEIDLQQVLQRASHHERFAIHAFGGDRNLFLTGLRPGFLQRRRDRRGAPGLRFYEEAGRTHYRSARDHPLSGEFALRETYDTLSGDFPRIRGCLNHLAVEYFN